MFELLGITGGNLGAFVAVILALLGGGFVVQTLRVKSSKKETAEEKKRADESEKQRQQQQQVVADSEEHKDKFVKQRDDTLDEIVPDIRDVKDIPVEEQKPLSPTVKASAKAQAERIKKRRANK